MKVAFVVGFFSPVEKALSVEFKKELDSRVLVFLGKPSPHQPFNFHAFKSHFFQAASLNDPDPILVIAADMRGLDWVRNSLEGIVGSGRSRGREVQLLFFADAQDADPVVDALHEFQLSGVPEDRVVSESMLMAYTKGQKIVCVRGQNQSSFEDALRRANFQFGRFEDHFLEIDLAYGPNVGETVTGYSKRHACLIYAWGELRYLQPATKRKWADPHEGKTPASAVARFKQAVLGHRVEEEDNL